MALHCPYLGLLSDPKTTTMYPTSDNACHRASPPASIALHYQNRCCLDQTHEKCPGYQVGWPDGFPNELRGQNPVKEKAVIPYWTLFLGIGLLAIIIIIGALSQISGSDNQPITINEGNLATHTLTNLGVQNATPTFTLAPTYTRTIEPSPTHTNTPTFPATQTPGPNLQTPFGSSGFIFVVHEVLAGQTMTIIADLYSSDVEIIEAINQFSPPERTTLWEGDILVVCVDCEDPYTLPKLQGVYVEAQMSITELAEIYNTSIEEFRQWNALGKSDQIETPRWIIVKAN